MRPARFSSVCAGCGTFFHAAGGDPSYAAYWRAERVRAWATGWVARERAGGVAARCAHCRGCLAEGGPGEVCAFCLADPLEAPCRACQRELRRQREQQRGGGRP